MPDFVNGAVLAVLTGFMGFMLVVAAMEGQVPIGDDLTPPPAAGETGPDLPGPTRPASDDAPRLLDLQKLWSGERDKGATDTERDDEGPKRQHKEAKDGRHPLDGDEGDEDRDDASDEPEEGDGTSGRDADDERDDAGEDEGDDGGHGSSDEDDEDSEDDD